ncbi:hypothetical protein AB0I28_08390 [Phytomonospora sp. NPDC050363]|uniref:hypothetical protein n=1 Tax=Phytomonospora sp. NPDC050363 TaxID=3155642 RepID=UPI0033E7D31A
MSLNLTRVLGDGPFAEIGAPTAVAAHDGLVAVGGDLGSLYWDGDGTARVGWRAHRLGVYESGGERCRVLIETRWPVNALDFHPSLPLLAVGTGSYDGGDYFDGELILLDVETGETVSLMPDEREVRRVRWADARTLEVVVAPPNDNDFPEPRERGFAEVIVRADWQTPEPYRLGEVAGRETVPSAAPPVSLREHAGEAWEPRDQVWAVAATNDGGVVVGRQGVLLEAWTAGGEPAWSVPDEGGAKQLLVDPGGRTALVNVTRPWREGPDGWHRGPDLVGRVSLDDGRLLTRLDEGWAAVLAGAADGSALMRHTNYREEHAAILLDPAGERAGTVALHGCDTFNHPFEVRGSALPLVLVGEPDAPHWDKWVAAVGPGADLDRLFPLEWEAGPGRHLFGGPGVVSGGTLVHAGTVHHGHGLLPGNAFVVARDFTGGSARWVHAGDIPVTALDTDGERVYAAFNSGELLVLDLENGEVLHREELVVRGRPVVALSLALDGPGRLLAGTVDGRILDFALDFAA